MNKACTPGKHSLGESGKCTGGSIESSPSPMKPVFATDMKHVYHQIENYRSLCGRSVRRWWHFFTDIVPDSTLKGRERKWPLLFCLKCKKALNEKGSPP